MRALTSKRRAIYVSSSIGRVDTVVARSTGMCRSHRRRGPSGFLVCIVHLGEVVECSCPSVNSREPEGGGCARVDEG